MVRKQHSKVATGEVAPTDNKHHVPARHWDKWSPRARAYFNELFSQLASNQAILAPPSAKDLPAKGWQVICWNFCWLATDLFDGR